LLLSFSNFYGGEIIILHVGILGYCGENVIRLAKTKMANSKENLYFAIISEMSGKKSSSSFTLQVTTPPSQPFIIRNPRFGIFILFLNAL